MRDPLENSTIDPRRALTYTLGALALMAVLALFRPSWAGTLVVILAFFLMIMLHELGHFVMAKRAGMKVTEFFVGFGPRIWSIQRGETEYGLKALPLGGYCKIIGLTNLEDVAPEDEPRTYRAKTYGKKMSVILAGSAMHFILAGLLMYPLLLSTGDLRSVDTRVVGVVLPDSPAASAGLEEGDVVTAFDGEEIDGFEDLVERVAAQEVGDSAQLTVERGAQTVTIDVVLAPHPDIAGRPYVGVSPSTDAPAVGVVEGLYLAPVRAVQAGGEAIKGFGRIFSPSGISNYWNTLTSGPESSDDAGSTPPTSGAASDQTSDDERLISVVGFGRLANQAVHSGWETVVGLLVMINISVGLLNLVPLLPFDGGHAAIATYEAVMSRVRRRKVQVDIAKLMPITVAVIAVLGFIFFSSVFMDISNPIDNPF